ncbi:MAG: DUF2461 domain-containing protein [Gammaproteobacteria bacterium]|nr:DUF2461 domain-containing protein [Gammaproteobacteria bacterium]
MDEKFSGFSADLLKFLNDLKKNNNRDWFNENKDRYLNSVANPICQFVAAMGPRLEKIAKYYVADPRRHGGSMFRIYRDARFSKDKRPYKEHVGCQFRHVAGKDAHAPGFYIHFEPNNILVGGGIWMPPSDALFKIRSAIAEKPDEWKKIVNNKSFKNRFGEIRGDTLTRPPRGFNKEYPMIEEIKRKSFFVMQPVDNKFIQTPKFITEVEHIFKAASPLMEFLTRAVELKYN